MKRTVRNFTLVCMLCAATALYAKAVISSFLVEPGYNKVTLRWETENEAGIEKYEVERGLTQIEFSRLGERPAQKSATGHNKYVYEDQTVFKSTANPRTYYYRIKIVKDDKSFAYSKVEKVTPTISSARQTWGSIKAMFR